MANSETVLVELELPTSQYEQLTSLARARQLTVVEIAHAAIVEWLENQDRLQQARASMRRLGRGLGEGPAPYDTARNHDGLLYGHHEGQEQ